MGLKIIDIDMDYENDDLFFYRSGDYKESVDLGQVILDIAMDGFPKGAELISVSSLVDATQESLEDITILKGEFIITEKDINVIITASVKISGQVTEKTIKASGINDIGLPASHTIMEA